MDDGFYRYGNMYCTVWCRTTEYSDFDNVYGVYVAIAGDECVMRSYRVVGTLANGLSFAGFLVNSLSRANSLALLSGDHAQIDESMPRRGQWVIVEAECEADALAHPDVASLRDSMLNPSPESFCGVYFISNGNGAVKIGQTTTYIRVRLQQLQAASAYKLYACASIRTESPKTLEKQLHKQLKDRRMHGEWFSLTDDEAIEIATRHGGSEVFVGREKTLV